MDFCENTKLVYSPAAVGGGVLGELRFGEDSGRGATGCTGLVCFVDSFFRLACLFSNIS